MRPRCIFVVWFLRSLCIFARGEDNTDELKVCLTELGCLKGVYMPGYQTEKFEAFLGVPYAKPPIGDLRFKNPEAATAWEDVLQATAAKADCKQKNYFVVSWPITGSEDCLYLNLYRPVQRGQTKLPVIFYIHGGAFFSGSPNPDALGPAYIMDTQEVILITVAYRLGPFGFLSTGDENMPGNFGLKDQNLALQWVRSNVALFEGDPQAVTIFGHSAGGSIVHYHMLSPASSGLFHRAIAMSGTALAPFAAVLQEPYAQVVQLSELAGVSQASTLSTSDLTKALQFVDADKLLNAGDALRYWQLNPLATFRPTIEQEGSSNAFLTAHPQTLTVTGNFTHVPWMMGLVPDKGEGAPLVLGIVENSQLRQEFNNNFEQLLSRMLAFPKEKPIPKIKEAMDLIIAEYFMGVRELNNATEGGFLELFGDVGFYYPFYKSVKHYVHNSDLEKNPLYLYKFSYRGEYSHSVAYSGGSTEDFGVVHLDDKLYLFRTPFFVPHDFERNSVAGKLVKDYVDTIVDFVKNGKSESFAHIEKCTEVDLQAAGDSGICNYLEFVNDGGEAFKKLVSNKFNTKRMKLWEKILAYSN